MNIIQLFFEKRVCDYVQCLQDVGYSMDEIFTFLPIAASSIFDNAQSSDLYKAISCLLDSRSPVALSHIDIGSISSKANITADQVLTGLNAIAPILLEDFCHKGESQTVDFLSKHGSPLLSEYRH